MSNLLYNLDLDIPAVIAWAEANDLRPTWIPADDVFVEGDKIRFREVVPVAGAESAEYPEAQMSEGELRVTEWQTVPLKAHPRDFGIEVSA